jgi:aspartyl-tRNA(Asn)/glutamyl-tRNA(Gln) amidotransferase subunit C
MKIDESLVEKVAGLARLSFSDDEKQKFTRQFTDILAFVEQLQEVDTSSMESMELHDLQDLIMGEDSPQECLSQQAALDNAPFSDDQFFLVPKVIEGEEE